MQTNKPIRRVPRPLGLTLSLRDKKDNEIPQQAKDLIIKSYIANNYTLNDKHYTIQQLSLLLKTNPKNIQTLIYQESMNLIGFSNLNPSSQDPLPPKQEKNPNNNTKHTTIDNIQSSMDMVIPNNNTTSLSQLDQQLHDQQQSWDQKLKEIVGIAFGGLFSESLSDRALIYEQAMLLKRAQGGGYKAFVSSEYGKVLKLLLDTHADMKDLLNIAQGPKLSQTIQVLNGTFEDPNKASKQDTEHTLTTDKAIMLISKSEIPQTLGNMDAIEALNQSYGIDDLPTVNANEQGTESSVPTLINPTESLDSSKIPHEDRRAEELEVDLDEDHVAN